MVALLSVAACSADSGDPNRAVTVIQDIAPAQAVTMLREDHRHADAPRVIDVRTPAEWEQGHVRGALHWPMADLDAKLALVEGDNGIDRRQPVVLYCASGGRASRAAKQFEDAGFADVRVVRPGGFRELAEAGAPVSTTP